jgi:O-antigen ligase
MTPVRFDRSNRTRGFDAVTLLTAYVILLFALPSRLIVGPLGAAGTPALLVALVAGLAWAWERTDQTEPVFIRPHPLRRATLVFGGAILASCVAGLVRPISADEVSSSDMGLLFLTSWVAIILVCDEAITDRGRLDVLVRRLVWAGCLVAALGLAQFIVKQPLTDLIQVPGLTINNQLQSIYARDAYVRPSGTAIHPIEFGVTMSVMLPLALHVAMQRESGGAVRRWLPVVVIAFAIPMSISRSAIVGAMVALLMVIPTWSKVTRRVTYACITAIVLFIFVAVPGILGTLASLFTGLTQDNSALSRTDSYSLAFDFIERSPLIGRGFMTFLPQYRILDNQYLGLLIDSGILGVLGLLALFATAIFIGVHRRALATDLATKSLAQALAAAVAAAAACFAVFDAFSFPMISGLTFLVIGLIAALESTESARLRWVEARRRTPAPIGPPSRT